MPAGEWEDDFNRADSDTVGEGWVEIEGADTFARIQDNTLEISRSGSNAISVAKSSITPTALERLDFRLKTVDNTKAISFSIRSSGSDSIAMSIGSVNGQLTYFAGGWQNVKAISNDTFYLISIRNIDFDANTYDIYVDDNLEKTGASFTVGASSLNDIRFVANVSGSKVTIDYIDRGAVAVIEKSSSTNDAFISIINIL